MYLSDQIYTFFWYEFSNNFDAKVILAKNFVREKLLPLNHSYLKYALVRKVKELFWRFDKYLKVWNCTLFPCYFTEPWAFDPVLLTT